MDINTKTKLIKDKAKELGFNNCGISKVEIINSEKENYNKWLNNGMNGEMTFMENNIDKRFDIGLLVENTKSVISLSFNYYPTKVHENPNGYIISKYAYGEDYHSILKNKLYEFYNYINDEIENIEGRVFVDSAPVLEKYWAVKSGLGWQGKNGLLISKENGSFNFLSEIIVDIDLNYDKPINNYCGTCTKCIDACPTNAFIKPYVLDARKCISYHTIEHKGDFDKKLDLDFKDRIFGCDICQDICPWNLDLKGTLEELFTPKFNISELNKTDWANLEKSDFNAFFKKSAIKRAKYEGLLRNIKYISDTKKADK